MTFHCLHTVNIVYRTRVVTRLKQWQMSTHTRFVWEDTLFISWFGLHSYEKYLIALEKWDTDTINMWWSLWILRVKLLATHQKKSPTFSLFLRKGGTICCKVSGILVRTSLIFSLANVMLEEGTFVDEGPNGESGSDLQPSGVSLKYR